MFFCCIIMDPNIWALFCLTIYIRVVQKVLSLTEILDLLRPSYLCMALTCTDINTEICFIRRGSVLTQQKCSTMALLFWWGLELLKLLLFIFVFCKYLCNIGRDNMPLPSMLIDVDFYWAIVWSVASYLLKKDYCCLTNIQWWKVKLQHPEGQYWFWPWFNR